MPSWIWDFQTKLNLNFHTIRNYKKKTKNIYKSKVISSFLSFLTHFFDKLKEKK